MPLSSYASRPDLKRTIWRSPLGPIGLVARGGRLTSILFRADPRAFPFEVERNYGSAGSEDPAVFTAARTQLEEYFAGRRLVFRLDLDLDQGTPFQRRVWKALQDIPYGQTLSYRDVARTIGQPSAVRAVGSANGKNPLPIVIPCHRVVAADGSIGGFSGGLEIKRKLLELEGNTRARITQLGLFSNGTRPSPPPRA